MNANDKKSLSQLIKRWNKNNKCNTNTRLSFLQHMSSKMLPCASQHINSHKQ